MKLRWMSSALLCTAALPACHSTSSMGSMAPELAEGVTYEVEFVPMWTAASHPIDYPAAGILTGPHFSGLIGASHRAGYELFAAGAKPTPGLERLSETGRHSPLDEEIRAAIAAGDAGRIFETDAIKELSTSTRTMVQVDGRFPRVSLVAMIAPSPDWFAGVHDVELHDGARWLATKEVMVYAWDSGGDAGTTYGAADADLDPKQPTRLNDAPPFVKGGERIPVARVVFRRQ